MLTRLLIAGLLVLSSFAAQAGPITARAGWRIVDTKLPFSTLVQRLEAAVTEHKMGVVNFASASEGAKAQGFTIPGNRVVGVYRNDFARRMLKASIPAGIEAPIRFYLVESADGGSTLAYRPPSTVFRPYFKGADKDLRALAAELDIVFAAIARSATAP